MQDLQDLEAFEIETLDLLNRIKVLDSLYFGGGTMLRLCHNLSRYSTDLDFWSKTTIDAKEMFMKIKQALDDRYKILDAEHKRFTMLFEFKLPSVRRNLKIEIRKNMIDFDWERKIAYSKFSTHQVIVNGLTLQQMMQNKISAILSRQLIRDCFDIEFLFMRGAELPTDKITLDSILKVIENFKDRDYKVTLGSILEEQERKFYFENRFKILREEIQLRLG